MVVETAKKSKSPKRVSQLPWEYVYTVLFPKGEFLKELYEGSLLFWVPLFYLLLFGFDFDPLRPVPFIVVGGWVGGWTGRIFAPIYLIFWYINKQNVLISNMFCILLYRFYIKSYDPFLLFLCWENIQLLINLRLFLSTLNRKSFLLFERERYSWWIEDQSIKSDWNAPWWRTYNKVRSIWTLLLFNLSL